jgi:hypothetical protein
MEALIPSELIDGGLPGRGGTLGLNLNLSVKGPDEDREVYWPARKSSGVARHPERWGTVVLAE